MTKTKQVNERAVKLDDAAKPAHLEKSAGAIRLANRGTHVKILVTLLEGKKHIEHAAHQVRQHVADLTQSAIASVHSKLDPGRALHIMPNRHAQIPDGSWPYVRTLITHRATTDFR